MMVLRPKDCRCGIYTLVSTSRVAFTSATYLSSSRTRTSEHSLLDDGEELWHLNKLWSWGLRRHEDESDLSLAYKKLGTA
jgi:hypothetical protein